MTLPSFRRLVIPFRIFDLSEARTIWRAAVPFRDLSHFQSSSHFRDYSLFRDISLIRRNTLVVRTPHPRLWHLSRRYWCWRNGNFRRKSNLKFVQKQKITTKINCFKLLRPLILFISKWNNQSQQYNTESLFLKKKKRKLFEFESHERDPRSVRLG